MALDLNRYRDFLGKMPGFGSYLSQALQEVQDGINNGFKSLGANATGSAITPDPIQQLTVKTNNNGLVHAVISDATPIQRNLHYFVEYDTSPAFSQPHVVHLGASRQMNPITLPALDDNGNPQQFYFRAYSQYPGGQPGQPIKFGGETATAVNPGGSQSMTLLSSTGSGTAQNTGEQGGAGFGFVLHRPGPAPKRQS